MDAYSHEHFLRAPSGPGTPAPRAGTELRGWRLCRSAITDLVSRESRRARTRTRVSSDTSAFLLSVDVAHTTATPHGQPRGFVTCSLRTPSILTRLPSNQRNIGRCLGVPDL